MKKFCICAVTLALMSLPLALCAQTLFSTSFEASEGYTPDLINGQVGWTESASPYEGSITDAVAYDGSQCLLFTANHGRAVTHALSAASDHVLVDVTMGKAYVNTAQWWFALQGVGGTSERSAAFGFNNGQLSYYSGGTGWVTFGAFNAGQAYRFQADVDIAAQKWSLSVDGAPVASDIPIYTATAVSATQVYIYRGYLSLSGLPADANYAAVDNLIVSQVPEPSSLLALAGGLFGLLGVVRRKR